MTHRVLFGRKADSRRYGRILKQFKNNLTEHHLLIVDRIFSWLLVTDRPLKVHEILDGVAFCTPPYDLNEQTKIRKQFLDLCKPLVEVSPEGTVSIVHFSANQYASIKVYYVAENHVDNLSGFFLTLQAVLS